MIVTQTIHDRATSLAKKQTYEELEQRVRELEHDAAELHQTHHLLQDRLETLTSPEDTEHQVTFVDLFDLEDIQRLQDQFADATGVASIITTPDGTPITRPSNFCRLCKDIIRKTDKGLSNCHRSDAVIGQLNLDGPIIQPCLSGGLWDSGAGISVGGRHLANWLIGQVRDEEQDEDTIRAYAAEIGADVEAAVEAFHEVPTMSQEQYTKVSQVLFTLANQLSTSAYQNIQQARIIAASDQTQIALNQSEVLHQTLVESIPDLVWLKDPDGVYLSCNQAFERFFGASESEIIGQTDYDFLDPELADFFRHHDNLAMEAGAPRTNEESLTFAVGGYHGFFETIKSPLCDADGRVIGVLGIARDITQRKQTEKDLRESEERFRSLHNASFGGITIHDGGVILECNQGLATMTGYSIEELVGMNGIILIAEQSRDMVIEKIKSGYELPYETVGLRRNGDEYPLRLEARNVPYRGKQVRTVEFRDITEIKRAEAEQRRLSDQLTQAQKMESIGQLAGGVAHDFNNLLQVILGFGEIAVEEAKDNEGVRSSVELMMKAGQRARTLVAQLLAFSRRQVLEVQDLDLNEIVGDMLQILGRMIGEHVDLEFQSGEVPGAIRADAGKIGQILTNLCVNARDAIPGGGTITIETGTLEVNTEPDETLDRIEPGRYALLKVTDNGCGMDQDTLDQVFEPFFTTKSIGEGTGLGLSTVYGLVKQHKGFVKVNSKMGQGTTFTIALPLSDRKPGTAVTSIDGPLRRGDETILLAEDDAMVRHLTRTLLEQGGYTVIEAANGEEALALFADHTNRIDMLLLDVIMPRLGGRAVYDRIRAIRPDIPILFASGYSMDSVHTDFVLEEGLALIQKPADRAVLLRKVRDVLDGPGS